MGHSSRTPPYTATMGTPPQSSSGPPLSPSTRMDASYGVSRPFISQSAGVTHSPPVNFGLSEQELIEHAARTTDRLMTAELRAPSLYNSLIQPNDPQLAQAG